MRPQEEQEKFILWCFSEQDAGRDIPPYIHQHLIKLVDARILGMDGFKYCWPKIAQQNRALVLREMK